MTSQVNDLPILSFHFQFVTKMYTLLSAFGSVCFQFVFQILLLFISSFKFSLVIDQFSFFFLFED